MRRVVGHLFFAVPMALVPLAVASAAQAQDGSYRSRTIVVFGDDPCPKATNPDEIIVCARRPEEERYRIPKNLREEERAAIARRDDVAAGRAALASGQPSATGIGSCSTAGAGGVIGCTRGLNVVQGAKTIIEGVKTATEPTDD